MASSVLELIIRAKDQTKEVLSEVADNASRTAGRLSEGFTRSGKALTAGLTLPIVGAGVAATKSLLDVESGLREVVTLTGQTGDEADATFERFKTQVRELSGEVGVAQSTLVDGLYQALSAGVPQETAFDFLQVASKASIAGVTDVETAVDGITTVLNAFGLDASEAEAVSDSLFTAVKGGKTTFEELSASLFNIAPAAAAANVDITEVNAAIATLTASGTPTKVATTQLRAALVGLQRPSEEMDAIFQKLGFANAQAAIESEGLAFALGAVSDAAAGDAGKLQTLLGSVEAVAAANVIAGTGAEKFSQEMENQANAIGATEAAFQEIEKSGSRSLERLFVSLQNLGSVFAEFLLPLVDKAVGFFQRLTDWFNNLSPAGQKVVGIAAGIAAALGPVLIVTGKVAKAFGPGGSLLKGFDAAKTGFSKLTKFLAANPYVAIAAATVAIVALIVANWDEIVAFLSRVWDTISGFISDNWELIVRILTLGLSDLVRLFVDNWDAISGVVSAVWDAIFGFISRNWELIVQLLFPGIGTLVVLFVENFDRIKGAVRAAIDFVKEHVINRIQEAWDRVRPIIETWQEVWGTIFETVGDVVDTVTEAIKTAWQGVSDFLGPIFETIGGWFTAFWQGVQTAVDNVVEFVTGLVEKIRGPLDWLVGKLQDLAGLLPGVGDGANDFAKVGSTNAFTVDGGTGPKPGLSLSQGPASDPALTETLDRLNTTLDSGLRAVMSTDETAEALRRRERELSQR